MKKQLLCFSGVVTFLILAVVMCSFSPEGFLKEASGSDIGPCLPNGKCGGDNDTGTCTYVADPVPGCAGSCGEQCAKGGYNWYCAGLCGSCTLSTPVCSQKYTGKCQEHWGIDVIICKCDPGSPTGTYCYKSYC